MTVHSPAICRTIRSFALAVLALVFAGCSGADLSSYRPLEKSAGSKTASSQRGTASPATAVVNDTTHDVEIAAPTDSATTTPVVEEQLSVSALGPVNVVDGASVASLLKVTPAVATAAAAPRKIEVLIPEKTFRTDGGSKALRVSFDDLDLLKVLNMEPVTIDAIDHMPP